jgi:hypothetical protein
MPMWWFAAMGWSLPSVGFTDATRSLSSDDELCCRITSKDKGLRMPRIIEPPRDQLDKLRQPMEPGEKTVMEALDPDVGKRKQPHYVDASTPTFTLEP